MSAAVRCSFANTTTDSEPYLNMIAAGTQTGDLVIWAGLLFSEDVGATMTPPAGADWVAIGSSYTHTGSYNNVKVYLWYRIAAADDDTSHYIFACDSSRSYAVLAVAISGQAASGFIHQNSGFSSISVGNPSLAANAPSVTTTLSNTLVLAFMAGKSSTAPGSPWTALNTGAVTLKAASRFYAAAGATDVATFTSFSDYWDVVPWTLAIAGTDSAAAGAPLPILMASYRRQRT